MATGPLRSSNDVTRACVSAASASLSESFETNAFSYLLFLKASARLAHTERELFLICDTRVNNSSFGNDFVKLNISIDALKAI